MLPARAALIAAASFVVLFSADRACAEAATGRMGFADMDLAGALNTLAHRTHVSILFRPDLVAGVRANEPGIAAGNPDRALAVMLRGTGLRARRIAPHTYVIERAEPPRPSDAGHGASVVRPLNPPVVAAPIVVTALRRPTLLLDTPLSMVVIDSDEWRELGGRTNADIARLAPSLALTPASAGLDRMSMRGVFSAGEPSVGLYYGSMPVSGPSGSTSDPGMMTPNLVLADIDRVEVLRGPQGTLYGAGSLAGTVRVLFHQPDLEADGGSLDLGASSVKGGGRGFDSQAVVNLALRPGKLALRAVGYRRREAGFVDDPALGRSNIGGRDDKGARLSLKWQPLTDWSLLVESAWQQTDYNGFGGESLDVGRDRTDRASQLPFSSRFLMLSATARGTVGFGDLELSASRYQWKPRRSFDFTHVLEQQKEDAHACAGYFDRAAPDCSPDELSEFGAYIDGVSPAMLDQPLTVTGTTIEARLSGSGDIGWTAGLFYNQRADSGRSYIYSVDDEGLPERADGLISWRRFDGTLRQFAAFGDMTWHVNPRLDLTGGMRFYSYRRLAEGLSIVRSPATEAFGSDVLVSRSYSASGIVGRGRADFHVSSSALVYAEIAQGFRPGGINIVPGLEADAVVYRSDRIVSRELGSRLSFARDRVQVSGALFRETWSDMQGSAASKNAFSIISNLGSARIDGAEFGLDTRIGRALHARLQATWIDARLTADQASDIAQASGRKGDRLAYVSPLNLSGSVTGQWPLGPGPWGEAARLVVNLYVDYSGRYYSLADRTSEQAMRMGGNGSMDLGGRLEFGACSVSLTLANLTDARGRVWATDTAFLPRTITRTSPRTITLGFGTTF